MPTLALRQQKPKKAKAKAKKGREKHQLDNDLQQIDTVRELRFSLPCCRARESPVFVSRPNPPPTVPF